MSLKSLAKKTVKFYKNQGLRATGQMTLRYVNWRLNAKFFRIQHMASLKSVGDGLKIRGDIRLKSKPDSAISIGNNVEIVGNLGRNTFFKVGNSGELQIEDEVFINRGCEIYASESVKFGYDSTVGPNVVIRDSDRHPVGDGPVKRGPVEIGPKSWIGTECVILAGVTIGRNSVVAAGSVVINDVPPNTLVGGVPAEKIRNIN